MPEITAPRSQRQQELMQLWKTRNGQNEVLGLMHRHLGRNESLKLGMTAFDVILDAEFGPASPEQTVETQIASETHLPPNGELSESQTDDGQSG